MPTDTTITPVLKAPFPWFGGKSRVAGIVWERFGDVKNYVEPFAGSLAVLLGRPTPPKVETVNDKDGFLSNFWRALKCAPEQTAHYADWPVNEIDLMARRDWLFAQKDHVERMMRDPDWYDAKLAGVWVWGVCSTIGNAWQPKSTHLGNAGMGIHRASTHLGDAGRGAAIAEYFAALAARLERVRVMCGDWTRVTSRSVTTKQRGLTGMFLDPPYLDKCSKVYDHTDDIRGAVRDYALAHGHEMRIALCGYEGEHEMPDDWECVAWKARGGYGSQSDKQGRENCKRERIWFSPMCIQGELFSGN
jgi:site-specific DNA-adenine methylase